MTGESSPLFEFGPFQIDTRRRLLSRGGRTVVITPKAFDILSLLVSNHGRIVEKSTILETVWPQTTVEEGNLTVNISMLRRVLGETRKEHAYVVTIPGRGYKFVADVRLVAEHDARPVEAGADIGIPVEHAGEQGSPRPLAPGTLHRLSTAAGRGGRRLLVASAIVLGFALPLLMQAQIASDGRSAEHAEARALYLRGRFFLSKRTEEGLLKGQQYFEQAIDRAPDYARAYAGLADTHSMLAYFGVVPTQQGHARAKSAALKALSLDPQSSEAHTSLAYIQHRFEWNWSAAERSFRRALSLDPDYPLARHWYASYLNAMGRRDEAITQGRRAEMLDPLTPVIGVNLDTMLHLEKPGDSIERGSRILEMDPTCWLAHWSVAESLRRQGRPAQAIEEYERAAELAGRSAFLLSRLGGAYALAGRMTEARAVLREIDQLDVDQYVSPFARVPVLAALGEHDAAFAWLERAFDERSSQLPFLAVSLTSLQSDPRFSTLSKRVGLR